MTRDGDALTQVTAVSVRSAAVPPASLCLEVLNGDSAGRALSLVPGQYVIGKAPGSTLRLADAEISRRHLSISVDERGVVLRDLGSKNGSFLGGVRFTEILASAGSMLRIGRTDLVLAAAGVAARLPPSRADRFGRLIGASLAMREVYGILERVAGSDVPVLIGGETGTGKELCAEAIHQKSAARHGPMVVCDLAGLPRTLIESELFGHVRGAFTGADRDRDGAFVRAHGGTIFLDEIGELEPAVQPRLLRVLEQRQVKPVGAFAYRSIDLRVVSATNRDLAAECAAGRFRADLFHRLGAVHVVLPPLRQRREDIPLLVESWLAPRGLTISDDALGMLMAHDWPGNVRELRNVVERGVSLLAGARRLEPVFLGLGGVRVATGPERGDVDYKRARRQLLGRWERDFLALVLARHDGNVAHAARAAGIDRAYFHRLMRKHALDGRD